MADEEKEKAEKLAAAKKRFEQLKKEQQKKGKKGGKKKDKETADNKKDDAVAEDEAPGVDEAVEETKADEADTQDEDAEATPSVSQQSKQRSESFRHGSGPQAEVQELYRKQAARIEELEKENKSLTEAHDTTSSRLTKTEEELEQLREGSSEIAELRTKAKDTDRLTTELASVQRQLTQAQQAAKGPARRQSGNNTDISEQLANKTSTIESLELDISNLRNQITTLESTLGERDSAAKDLEERAQTAEIATSAAKEELDALRVSIAFPADSTNASDPEALTKRITILESDLRTANTHATNAASRAKSLEQKIEALTKLHKEATSISQTQAKELTDLRSQLQKRQHAHRNSHVRDASDFELGEEETEAGALQTRIRALEAENFDLRRGVWRDKRAEMQPGMDEMPSYDDVDLHSPGGAATRGLPRQTSTFQDVITSGINAFTGRPAAAATGTTARDRAESMGLMSDDGGFDEDAFRLAQEEEAKRRIERIREVKRGLDDWKGWRVDIADQRGSGMGPGRDIGPVFEV